MRWLLPLVLCCALAPAFAAEHVPATDEELSAVFLCPESLIDDNARETAVEASGLTGNGTITATVQSGNSTVNPPPVVTDPEHRIRIMLSPLGMGTYTET